MPDEPEGKLMRLEFTVADYNTLIDRIEELERRVERQAEDISLLNKCIDNLDSRTSASVVYG